MVWSPFVGAAWVHEFRPDRCRSAAPSCRCQALVPGRPRTSPDREALKILGSRLMNTRRYSPVSTANLRTTATATRVQFWG